MFGTEGMEEAREETRPDRTRALAEAAIAIARADSIPEVLRLTGLHARELVDIDSASADLLSDTGSEAPGALDVPLRDRQGVAIGVLRLSQKTQGRFTGEDEAILVQLAQMAAASIENAWLREALEEANRRERERSQEIEALMDTLPAAVWIAHDREASIITGNRASYDVLRLTSGVNTSLTTCDGIMPTNFRVMRDGREVPPEELPVQQAAKWGRYVNDFEEQLVFDDGEVRTLFGNVVPLFDAEGKSRGAVAAFLDITPLKDAEREVRRGVERYRALAEAAASVVFSADARGQVTSLPLLRGMNPQMAEEGLGFGWLRSIHPDDRARATERWHHAIHTRDPYEVEFRIRMADGDYRWHLARGVFVGGEGEPGEWIGACVDVHDRVTIERELSLLNVLTAATRAARTPREVIMVTQRLLGEYLKVTRCAYGEPTSGGRGFDMPPNYCVGCEDLSGRFPLSGYDSSISKNLRAGKTLLVHDVAAEMGAEDGREAYLAAAIGAAICVPLVKDGRPVAMLGVHQDRPRTWSSDEVDLVRSVLERMWSELERVRAGDAVQRSEQRLRQTLEAATVGFALNDVDGRFLYANEPMLRMLGYTAEDLAAGRLTWNAIQVPERRPKDDLALDQLRATGTCAPYETEFIRRDGNRLPVYVGAALVPDAEGAGLLGAAFVTDLTPLKEAERELVRLNADLERRVQERTRELEFANREMEGFNYTVAHDLRGPLRTIVSTSRILAEEAQGVLSAEQLRLLERQAVNATHLARLLDDLLVYSRISRQDVRREEIDLTDLARRVAELACEGRIDDLTIAEDLRAEADPSLLRLVLQNLLENACKFSPQGGTITFGHDDAAFFVRDTGVGFDMAYARKLFEPFERLVRQDEFPGTGIGLANVKRVVERHGGRVWAQSKPGEGATFWFTLQPDGAGDV
jgi:PAS domain S-box-containing protein